MNGHDTVPSQQSGKPQGSQGEPCGFLAPFDVHIDTELLKQALTHRSWAYERGDAPHNERLEFLGDSVLGLSVTARLYREYPHLSEGELTLRRAALVSTHALARIARSIDLGAQLRLGKGERRSGGREKESILADTVEALIGAVFVSSGHVAADAFVRQLTDPLFATVEELVLFFDPKTTLQEEAAARGEGFPQYDVTGVGPQHDRVFTAHVTLDGLHGEGSGSNKKAAELLAAKQVVEQLRDAGKLRTITMPDA